MAHDAHLQTDPPPEPPALRSDASYLITGGTGGIGRSLARWMAAEGAKFIILASRSGQAADGIQMLVQDMEDIGTRVVVQQCDIGSETDVQELIRFAAAQGLPPLAGVVHGAMVLQVCGGFFSDERSSQLHRMFFSRGLQSRTIARS